MPRVPYTPYPELPIERERFASKIGIQAPEVAFGGEMARATEKLGQVLESAGDKVFAQAMVDKHLNNETKARDISLDAATDISEMDEKYRRLPRDQAEQALPGHIQAVKDRAKKAQDDATASAGPEVGNMVGANVTGHAERAIIRAGDHAGEEARRSSEESMNAGIKVQGNMLDADSPTYEEDIRKLRNSTRQKLARVGGLKGDALEDGVTTTTSPIILKNILKNAPVAKDLDALEEKVSNMRNLMDPNDWNQAMNFIHEQQQQRGARTSAERPSGPAAEYDPAKAAEDPSYMGKLNNRAMVEANSHPDAPNYHDNYLQKYREQIRMKNEAFLQNLHANKNLVERFAMGPDHAHRITSMDGINGPNAPEDVRNAYNALPPSMQRDIQRYVLKPEPQQYTADMQRRYWYLRGLEESDPKSFAQMQFLNEDLPRGKIDDLMNRAQRVDKNIENPSGKLGPYRDYITTYGHRLGLADSSSDTDQARQWNEYIGAMHDKVDQFQRDHGKMPGKSDITEMMKDVSRNIIMPATKGGGLFSTIFGAGNQTIRRFDVTVPDDAQDQMRGVLRKNLNREPSEEELRDYYINLKLKTGEWKLGEPDR